MLPSVSPWLQFTLIAAGVLLAIGAVGSLALGGLNRKTIPAGVAAIVPAVFLIVMPVQLGLSTDRANTQRHDNAGTSETQARERCLTDGHADGLIPFVDYLNKTLPAGASYAATSPGQTDNACLTYVLMPHEHVDFDKAQYLVFIGAVPTWLKLRVQPGTYHTFAPGQAVGKVKA
jgi:hypothetical protein